MKVVDLEFYDPDEVPSAACAGCAKLASYKKEIEALRYNLPAAMTARGWDQLRAARAKAKQERKLREEIQEQRSKDMNIIRAHERLQKAYEQACKDRDTWAEKYDDLKYGSQGP